MFVLIVLPFLAVYQGQSFEVQSEDEHLLPSDSRTCGLRRELDVFRRGQWGGGEVVITIHTSKNYHLYKRALCVGLEKKCLLFSFVGSFRGTKCRNVTMWLYFLLKCKTQVAWNGNSEKYLRNGLWVFKTHSTTVCAQRGSSAVNQLSPHVNSFGQRKKKVLKRTTAMLTSAWGDPTPPPAQHGPWAWSQTLKRD